jgi:hypothetical protein
MSKKKAPFILWSIVKNVHSFYATPKLSERHDGLTISLFAALDFQAKKGNYDDS